MKNILFEAKIAWEKGRREEGYKILNTFLVNKLNCEVFNKPEIILSSKIYDRFLSALNNILIDNSFLQIPFGKVFVVLWEIAPIQPMINALCQKDFSDPYFDEIYGIDEISGLDYNKMRLEECEIISKEILKSAREGLIGPNELEQPNGGRAVLTMERIKNIKDAQWGALKTMLLRDLPLEYGNCPTDFWKQLALNTPYKTLSRFLFDLFGEHNHTLNVAEKRWDIINTQFPDYANAIYDSIDTILKSDYKVEDVEGLLLTSTGWEQIYEGDNILNVLEAALKTYDFSLLK